MALEDYRRVTISSDYANEPIDPIRLSAGDDNGRILRFVLKNGENNVSTTGLTCRFLIDQGAGLYQTLTPVTGTTTATWEAPLPMGGVTAGQHVGTIEVTDSNDNVVCSRNFSIIVEMSVFANGEEQQSMQDALSDFEQRVQAAQTKIDNIDIEMDVSTGVLSVTDGDGVTVQYSIDDDIVAAVNAWLVAHPEATTTVQDNSITDAKLVQTGGVLETVFGKLTADVGKNLFNKNAYNKVSGFYVRYNDGQVATNANFTTVWLPVAAGTVLSFSQASIHVCALSVEPNLIDATAGQSLSGYISGFADNSRKQGYVVPAGAVGLTVSFNNSWADTMQIEVGTATTAYEQYKSGISVSKLIGFDLLTVGSGMQYQTIQSAVDAASDHAVIYVKNGTYDEAVDVRSSGKFLNLIGESRDGVILTHDGSSYYEPPLEIASGTVRNMTIIRTGTEYTSVYGAYCAHIDFDNLRNSSLQFENVRFVNTTRECVGIGLRKNCRLSFIDCDFTVDSMNAFYCHEEQADNCTNQYVELINCSLRRTTDGSVIKLQETPAFTGSEMTIRMQRCIVKNGGNSVMVITASQYGSGGNGLTDSGYLGTNAWTLDVMSALNSNATLNA